ncbi:MAG: hypothetical protein SFX18_06895 [Pirellulales bacterium]|nr:hypothetical protein [Pirellulales bacterium]
MPKKPQNDFEVIEPALPVVEQVLELEPANVATLEAPRAMSLAGMVRNLTRDLSRLATPGEVNLIVNLAFSSTAKHYGADLARFVLSKNDSGGNCLLVGGDPNAHLSGILANNGDPSRFFFASLSDAQELASNFPILALFPPAKLGPDGAEPWLELAQQAANSGAAVLIVCGVKGDESRRRWKLDIGEQPRSIAHRIWLCGTGRTPSEPHTVCPFVDDDAAPGAYIFKESGGSVSLLPGRHKDWRAVLRHNGGTDWTL